MTVDFPLSTEFLNGLGVVGFCVFVFLLLVFGKGIALTREVKQRDVIIAKQDATIEWQRMSMDEKDEQLRDLIGGTRVTTESLQRVSRAAEQIAGGEGG